jgi:hypothetical protein
VGLDNRSRNNQSHAEPVALRREELLKNLFSLGRQTNAEVAHAHPHTGLAIAPGREDHHSLRGGHFLHRIKGVDNKAEEHLLELNSDSSDLGQVCFEADA